MKKHVKILVLISLLAALSGGCTSVCYVPVDPPAARSEVRSDRPGSKYTWSAGHWKWNGKRYVWVDGHWIKNKKNSSWIAGHWKKTPRGHVWVDGHWR